MTSKRGVSMRWLVMGTVAAVLAGCGPGDGVEQAVAPVNGCAAAASGAWSSFQIAANVSGGECATAEASIALTNEAGEQVWAQSYLVAHVMTLADAATAQDMQRRLAEWITSAGPALDSAGDLPDWPRGAATPVGGEFPFYTDEGVTQAQCTALRAGDAPMFCYVQGMESLRCLIDDNGQIATLGVQSFPG